MVAVGWGRGGKRGGTLKWSGGAKGQNRVDKELSPPRWQRLKGTPRLPGGEVEVGGGLGGWVEYLRQGHA